MVRGWDLFQNCVTALNQNANVEATIYVFVALGRHCIFSCCMQSQQFCMLIVIYPLVYFSGQQPLVSSLCLMMQRPKPAMLNHYVSREILTSVLYMQRRLAGFILSSDNNCGPHTNNIKNCFPSCVVK